MSCVKSSLDKLFCISVQYWTEEFVEAISSQRDSLTLAMGLSTFKCYVSNCSKGRRLALCCVSETSVLKMR